MSRVYWQWIRQKVESPNMPSLRRERLVIGSCTTCCARSTNSPRSNARNVLPRCFPNLSSVGSRHRGIEFGVGSIVAHRSPTLDGRPGSSSEVFDLGASCSGRRSARVSRPRRSVRPKVSRAIRRPWLQRISCSQSTFRRRETFGQALGRGQETRAQQTLAPSATKTN